MVQLGVLEGKPTAAPLCWEDADRAREAGRGRSTLRTLKTSAAVGRSTGSLSRQLIAMAQTAAGASSGLHKQASLEMLPRGCIMLNVRSHEQATPTCSCMEVYEKPFCGGSDPEESVCLTLS